MNEVCLDDATVRECDWVTGCYYLVRREVVDQVGLFDPRFFLYYEEVDHCRRVRQAGWSVVCYPLYSRSCISAAKARSPLAPLTAGRQISELAIESELLYFRKHYGAHRRAGRCIAGNFGWRDKCLQRSPTAAGIRPGPLSAAQHVSAQLRALVTTRLASRPTR